MPNYAQSYYLFYSDASKHGDTQVKILLEQCKKFVENADLDEPITKTSFASPVLPYPDEYDREWGCEHWGTKWSETMFKIDSIEIENDFENPYGFHISITTAWCNFSDEWIKCSWNGDRSNYCLTRNVKKKIRQENDNRRRTSRQFIGNINTSKCCYGFIWNDSTSTS